jgi:uncharacterized delta-60 repeat protein
VYDPMMRLLPVLVASSLVFVFVVACGSSSDDSGGSGGPDGGGPPPPPGPPGDDAGGDASDGAPPTATFAPDTTFGNAGLVGLDLGGSEESLATLTVQADGSVVLVGSTARTPTAVSVGDLADVFVARFTPTGQPDATFGNGGKALFPTVFAADPRAATVQADGKILIVGRTTRFDSQGDSMMVMRIDGKGALDTTFGKSGLVVDTFGTAHAVTVQGDGKVLVAGDFAGMAVVRYGVDGTRDKTFNTTGLVQIGALVESHAYGIGIQTGGAIALGGEAKNFAPTYDHDGLLARVTSAGAADTTFNTNGQELVTLAGPPYDVASMATGPSDTFVLAATSGATTYLDRFTSTGARDATWGTAGSATIAAGALLDPIDVDATGRVSFASGNTVLRYTNAGTPDATFGAAGVSGATALPGTLRAFGRAANGTYFLGGQPAVGIAAVHVGATGTPDGAYGSSGVALATSGASREEMLGVAVQADGQILAGGRHLVDHPFFVRYDASGKPDATFGTNGRVEEAALVPIAFVGPVVASGGGFYFAYSTGNPSTTALLRYTAAGAHDATFGTAGVAAYNSVYTSPTSVVVDGKGRPVVAVDDITFGGFILLRYTTAGVLDTTFGTNGIVKTTVNGTPSADTVAVMPDGRMLVAGVGIASVSVARYLESGALDTTFGTAGTTTFTTNGVPERVVAMGDGSVLLVGASDTGVSAPPGVWLAHLGASGTLDASFGTAGIVKTPTGMVGARVDVVVKPDGILVATSASDDGAHANILFLRYVPSSGALDAGFGTGGKQRLSVSKGNDIVQAAALDASGRMLLAGRTWSPTTGTDAMLLRVK